jgi:cytochrome P450
MTVLNAATTTGASPSAGAARDAAKERGAPLLGVLPRLLGNPPAFLQAVSAAHPGELVAVRLGPMWLYVISQPEHLQHVLVDNARNFTKGRMWDATRQLFGNGLLRSEGEFWLRQRRMMQPLFGAKHLASLASVMVEVIDREVARLAQASKPEVPLDLGVVMTSLTQRILLETMFGTTISGEDAARLGQRVVDALRVINLKVFLFFLPDKFPLPGSARLRRAVQAIDKAMLGLVAQRRGSNDKRNDLLELLLNARDDQSREGMDDHQLRDELVNLLVAGNDTTANALTFFWYALAAHPAVEQRVREELELVLGGRPPSYDDLARLTYTRMVLYETMRLYPPVWMFPRFCVEDDVVGGYRIPAGSAVLVVPWLTHRDPRLWDRPEEFDPDRFLPKASAERGRYVYFPFGGGPRQCIGNTFAMIEAPLIVARMAQAFRFRLTPGYRLVPSSMSTLKPKGGLPVFVERNVRAGSKSAEDAHV